MPLAVVGGAFHLSSPTPTPIPPAPLSPPPPPLLLLLLLPLEVLVLVLSVAKLRSLRDGRPCWSKWMKVTEAEALSNEPASKSREAAAAAAAADPLFCSAAAPASMPTAAGVAAAAAAALPRAPAPAAGGANVAAVAAAVAAAAAAPKGKVEGGLLRGQFEFAAAVVVALPLSPPPASPRSLPRFGLRCSLSSTGAEDPSLAAAAAAAAAAVEDEAAPPRGRRLKRGFSAGEEASTSLRRGLIVAVSEAAVADGGDGEGTSSHVPHLHEELRACTRTGEAKGSR